MHYLNGIPSYFVLPSDGFSPGVVISLHPLNIRKLFSVKKRFLGGYSHEKKGILYPRWYVL